MRFKDRTEAGNLLAQALEKFRGQDVIVYALPRGGITLAIEIARYLKAPLDLIIARKIGHPLNPECAIAAVAEDGCLIGENIEDYYVEKSWFEKVKQKQMLEAKRRREVYLKNLKMPSCEGKVAILVDDGIATGLTMEMGIKELKHRHPKKIIVAVPVSPKDTAEKFRNLADEFVALDVPKNYLGAVGCYYHNFPQVEDEEVISILHNYSLEYEKSKI